MTPSQDSQGRYIAPGESRTAADVSVGSFDQLTNTGAEARVFGPLGPTSRWRWTIGGTDTPSFTFSIASTVDRDG